MSGKNGLLLVCLPDVHVSYEGSLPHLVIDCVNDRNVVAALSDCFNNLNASQEVM